MLSSTNTQNSQLFTFNIRAGTLYGVFVLFLYIQVHYRTLAILFYYTILTTPAYNNLLNNVINGLFLALNIYIHISKYKPPNMYKSLFIVCMSLLWWTHPVSVSRIYTYVFAYKLDDFLDLTQFLSVYFSNFSYCFFRFWLRDLFMPATPTLQRAYMAFCSPYTTTCGWESFWRCS